jgi:hypothetical protein
MSRVLNRPPALAAESLHPDIPSETRAASLEEARRTRLDPRPARKAILRPINLERRARFARIEADAPRGA